MEDEPHIDSGDLLTGCLKEFKLLEKQLPEIARLLGFAGYVQYTILSTYSNERYAQLERIPDSLKALQNKLSNIINSAGQ